MIEAVTIGTRTSRLALWQSEHVAALLVALQPGLQATLQPFVTQGDKTLDRPLPAIGGKGLFTAELEQALLSGAIDLAVHSLKDLPVEQPSGLTLGAIIRRGDVRDCVVAKQGWTLATLPAGAVVGTSSPRRRAQLEAMRPDLVIRSVRGNVETRARKALEGEYDAVILAAAGVQRLELENLVTEWLPADLLLPAPGQGALAVQCRAGNEPLLSLLAEIDDSDTRLATSAERRFLQLLGGGCAAPIAALAQRRADGMYTLSVFTALRNAAPVQMAESGTDPLVLAETLAERVLASARGQDKPLAGRRIVVTRPQQQAQSLHRSLTELGAQVIAAPAIEIAPVDDTEPLRQSLRRLDEYRWIVFTSANAVRVFLAALEEEGLPANAAAACRIAAVGPATEGALLAAGLHAGYVPDQYLGEAIARGVDVEPGERVLLPRAVDGGSELPEILTARGAVVDDIAIYRSCPVALTAESVQALERGVDAVIFTSGSTARRFAAALAQTALADLLERCTIVCIGPKTAEAVRQLGYTPHVTADVHTEEGLIEALIDRYRGTTR
ncbi:MAG: hydroxymethylbilane synthase [Chloroflexota bacterium]|nr:hydroxymethylbilane synthase [Chloroflexota bacterium]